MIVYCSDWLLTFLLPPENIIIIGLKGKPLKWLRGGPGEYHLQIRTTET